MGKKKPAKPAEETKEEPKTDDLPCLGCGHRSMALLGSLCLHTDPDACGTCRAVQFRVASLRDVSDVVKAESAEVAAEGASDGQSGETEAAYAPAYVGTPTLRDEYVAALIAERSATLRRITAEDALARRIEGSKPITIDIGEGPAKFKAKKRKNMEHGQPGAMFLSPLDPTIKSGDKEPDYD